MNPTYVYVLKENSLFNALVESDKLSKYITTNYNVIYVKIGRTNDDDTSNIGEFNSESADWENMFKEDKKDGYESMVFYANDIIPEDIKLLLFEELGIKSELIRKMVKL